MEYCLAVYSSITFANRVKKLIIPDGDYVGVIHTPRSISPGGCSYALRFRKHKLGLIKQISQNLGIKIKGIYVEENINGVRKYKKIS